MATTVASSSAQDLSGSCEGATPSCAPALLGAFAMAQGSRGTARTADQVFAAVRAAATASQGGTTSKEGELTPAGPRGPTRRRRRSAAMRRCAWSSPSRCSTGKGGGGRGSGEAGRRRVPEAAEPVPARDGAERGEVLPACARARAPCGPTDARACAAECGKGDVGSCYHLGIQHLGGKDFPRDDARAAELFEKACGAGVTQACYARGEAAPA